MSGDQPIIIISEPINIFQRIPQSESEVSIPIRLCYDGDHYNSLKETEEDKRIKDADIEFIDELEVRLAQLKSFAPVAAASVTRYSGLMSAASSHQRRGRRNTGTVTSEVNDPGYKDVSGPRGRATGPIFPSIPVVPPGEQHRPRWAELEAGVKRKILK